MAIRQGAALLRAPGSLSARLRGLGASFDVQVLREGPGRLGDDESRDLGLRPGGQGWIREVLLRVDGRPCVLARSVTPLTAARGAWRAIRNLGRRPLADLLYARHELQRTPLEIFRLPPQAPWRTRLARLPGVAAPSAGFLWGRHSVFYRRGQPLRVMEIFLGLPAPGGTEASAPSR